MKIRNGGIELGILEIVGSDALSQKDLDRKAYLESLPKNEWIALDENGKAITQQQAEERENAKMERYKPF